MAYHAAKLHFRQQKDVKIGCNISPPNHPKMALDGVVSINNMNPSRVENFQEVARVSFFFHSLTVWEVQREIRKWLILVS